MQKSISNNSVKFKWVRKICSAFDWKTKYARDDKDKYSILNIRKEGKDVKEFEFAYMAVGETLDLEITEYDELQKINEFCKSKNLYPRPFE